MTWETKVQSQVVSCQKIKKWYLIPSCLTLSIIRYGSRVKWNTAGKRVVPSPTPRCSSYWKGTLWVTLNCGCQVDLLYNDIVFKIVLLINSVYQLLKKKQTGLNSSVFDWSKIRIKELELFLRMRDKDLSFMISNILYLESREKSFCYLLSFA